MRSFIHVNDAGWVRETSDEAFQLTQQHAPALFRYQWNEGRTLSEFVMVLIPEGEGELETRHGSHAIPAGTVFLLRPGEWHRHRPLPATGWINMWIAFNGDLPRRWVHENGFDLLGNIAVIEDYALFLAQFERLLLSVHSAPAENTFKLSCQLLGLLSHFLQDNPNQQTQLLHDDALVSKALSFIWGNAFESVSVLDVAKHVGCGRRCLERRFKDGAGRSILAEIQACRIDRAKRLLVETRIPLKECAARAGFSTSGHMRQVFRQHFGIAPEAFRQQTQAS